jgi:hypothetical protein
MTTDFKPVLLSAVSADSAGAESIRKAFEARLKLLETFLGGQLAETFATNIRDLWSFAGTAETIDVSTLADKFPQWKLEMENYNILRAWSCSMVQITEVRTKVLEIYGFPEELGEPKDDLNSASQLETWMATQANKARWNMTLFRIPSFDPADQQGTPNVVRFVVHDNCLGEGIFAVSENAKLFKVLPPTILTAALSQEVRPKYSPIGFIYLN